MELLNEYSWERYGDFLEVEGVEGKEHRKNVLDYVVREDSSRSMNYQLDLIKKAVLAVSKFYIKIGVSELLVELNTDELFFKF
ncbi:hypothetical protein QWY99_05880 [Flavobacterium branchiarum]|uniref:Uncharacterized protein n=1 Tax=Flavobacterium branchiarum TaxID=1114870 RepID=A0ABV5FQR0_9FLAO|nr:hypothetical protein [Flavobacterium branchiarum]MDN3672585.1 hypothetical protein [Flavobacterium branchiarum]